MGGTSADVALIRNYEAGLSFDRAVAGFPIRLPMVDIHTVGAGGGSIAWFDRDGLLKVGPSSAGADPGPACYGKGGKSATVTDANLVLGRLSAKGLIGGRMPLDPDAARAAIEPIAERLELSRSNAPRFGIIEIVVANMVRAIRTVSVERGHDPRNYCLLAVRRRGAAARERSGARARHLSFPGAGRTRHLVRAGPDRIRSKGRHRPLRPRAGSSKAIFGRIREILESLDNRTRDAWFARESVKPADRRVNVSFDMRYVGQNFELPVPVGVRRRAARLPELGRAETLRSRFFAVHDQFYGFHNDADPVEIINVRLTASAAMTEIAQAQACQGEDEHGRSPSTIGTSGSPMQAGEDADLRPRRTAARASDHRPGDHRAVRFDNRALSGRPRSSSTMPCNLLVKVQS